MSCLLIGNPYCKPPNFSSPLSTKITEPTKIKKLDDFMITTGVATHCRNSSQVQLVYDIQIYAIEENTAAFKRVRWTIGTSAGGDLVYIIYARSLDYGLYYYKLTGIIEIQIGTSANSFGYIEITSSALIVNITGDRIASQGFNKTLTLNGSLSHDPDIGKGDHQGLNFTWLCRRDEENFPNDTNVPVVLSLPIFSKRGDRGGCYGSGVGRLLSRPGFPYILDLDLDKMKGNQNYVIKLVLSRGKQIASAIHRLRIKKEINVEIR